MSRLTDEEFDAMEQRVLRVREIREAIDGGACLLQISQRELDALATDVDRLLREFRVLRAIGEWRPRLPTAAEVTAHLVAHPVDRNGVANPPPWVARWSKWQVRAYETDSGYIFAVALARIVDGEIRWLFDSGDCRVADYRTRADAAMRPMGTDENGDPVAWPEVMT